MNLDIRFYQDSGWCGYTIFRDNKPFQGGVLKTKRAAAKQAAIELKKLKQGASR